MRLWPALVAAAAALAVVIPIARHLASAREHSSQSPAASSSEALSNPDAVSPPALSGLQIDHLFVGRSEVTAPAAAARLAHLSLDPDLQRTTQRLFAKMSVPEGAVVLMDLKSARLLVYASHQSTGAKRDLCAEAQAPSASVFKIITGATLIEQGKATPQTRQCYRGGLHNLQLIDLQDDPQRDKYCATLSEAMGRSLNAVFGRLALHNLTRPQLETTAAAFGFNQPLRFDLPVQPSTLSIPDGDLEFGRTAAGFWNSTLSPLQALSIASTVASRGQVLRPVLVNSVSDNSGNAIYRAPASPQVVRRAIRPETADALREMMETTVTSGTAFQAFHDRKGRPYLPGIKVAAKTGTLTRASSGQFYTWLVGFAPSDAPEVAFSVLVVNRPQWQTKANTLAREVLRAYFASKGAPGVTAP